jgi:hypothetical protein
VSSPPPYDFSGQDPFSQQPGYGQPGYGQPSSGSGYGDPNLGGGYGTPAPTGNELVPFSDPFNAGGYGTPPGPEGYAAGYASGSPAAGGYGRPASAAGSASSYLWLSILLTVLSLITCSWFLIGFIIGIVAIVFSVQASSLNGRGDLDGAAKASRTALILNIVTGVMLGTTILGEVLVVVAGIWSFNSLTG